MSFTSFECWSISPDSRHSQHVCTFPSSSFTIPVPWHFLQFLFAIFLSLKKINGSWFKKIAVLFVNLFKASFLNTNMDQTLLDILILLALLWTVPWKGFALWKAAKKNHVIWFIVLLIVNTLAVLEILYIFWFSKLGNKVKKRK